MKDCVARAWKVKPQMAGNKVREEIGELHRQGFVCYCGIMLRARGVMKKYQGGECMCVCVCVCVCACVRL